MNTTPIARRIMILTAGFAAIAVFACSSDPTSAAPVVQMTAADASPRIVRCAGGAVPDSMVWELQLVNTTDEDVPIVSVASAGTIIRSSNTALVGNSIVVVADVPFTPDSAILMARRGDREIRAMLPVAPFCAQPTQWKDVYVSLRVIAGNWQVVSPWIEIAVR